MQPAMRFPITSIRVITRFYGTLVSNRTRGASTWGNGFEKKDSHDAAYYLREKGLIREIETSTLLGDTVEITGDGIDCIERHAGSVSRFLNPKGIPMVNIDNVSQPGVFISYVREDSDRVDSLQRTLEAASVPVWRDVTHLWPGEDWRARIRYAITRDSIVFIACFSNESNVRRTSYQREELLLAIDQLRLRRPDDPWFIPIRFDDCSLPDLDIGGGRSLASIQGVDLFGDRRDEGIARLVTSIRRILGPPRDQGHTELQQAPIQASARRAEVWPGVDREASMGFTPDWYLVLENTGDAPALDVRASFSFARGYDRYPDYFNRFGDDYEGRVSHRAVSGHGSTWELRDTSSSQEPDIERLAPRSRQRFRLLIDEESPRQMNCTVSWADERGRHENTATLRLE
jgi:hypothetical protein